MLYQSIIKHADNTVVCFGSKVCFENWKLKIMHEKFNKILYYKTSRESLTVLCSVMKHLGSSLQVCVASISKCSSSLVFILDYSLKREGWAGLMLFYLYPPFLIFHSLLTTPPQPNPTPTPLELHSSHVSLYSERSVQNYLPIFFT